MILRFVRPRLLCGPIAVRAEISTDNQNYSRWIFHGEQLSGRILQSLLSLGGKHAALTYANHRSVWALRFNRPTCGVRKFSRYGTA